MSRYYTEKSTKEIKAALHAEFRYVKFSVRRDRGTASHYINISWTDGPSDDRVKSFCGQFNDTANDDIMTDLWCGSQYTNCHRNISISAFCWAVKQVCDRYLIPYPIVLYTLDNYSESAWIKPEDDVYVCENSHERISYEVHRLLRQTDLRKIDLRNSYTAREGSAIIKTGRYGYTQYTADLGQSRYDRERDKLVPAAAMTAESIPSEAYNYQI